MCIRDSYNNRFCLHYTTEHMRHGRVGQPGPRYVLIATISSNKMDKIHQVRSYMRQSRTRKPQKPLVRKNRDRVPPTKCSGATFGVWRSIYEELETCVNELLSANIKERRLKKFDSHVGIFSGLKENASSLISWMENRIFIPMKSTDNPSLYCFFYSFNLRPVDYFHQ